MNELINRLKENNEDFEFYPTTKEMVRTIWKHAVNKEYDGANLHWDVLDIGCGTCNFKKWINEINSEEQGSVNISKYCVIEKSRILIEKLEPDTIVLGTDFHECTLIDKDCDTIFCNPPYSEYEEWMIRIIKESRCKNIYLIVPERWKDNERIKQALNKIRVPFSQKIKENNCIKIIGSSDFLHAERNARAKVDILYIDKSYTNKDSGFDAMFDELFGMQDTTNSEYEYEYGEIKEAELKKELISGKNKVEILCNGYNEARNQLFHHFKTIAELDSGVLKAIGVNKDTVKKALKEKMAGLKNLYWKSAFDCLDEITSRLTSTSRNKILNRFLDLKKVDFTPSNLYAMIIWVIKNYNKYTEEQMIDLFYALSSEENVKNYVSNQKVFVKYFSRCSDDKPTHYTLDYRIVCTTYALPCYDRDYYNRNSLKNENWTKIQDICTVVNNLGFPIGEINCPEEYGDKGTVYGTDNKVLFEFRCYKNGNVHIKFNIEVMKAFNVAVAQKLGWIRKQEDINKEFANEEMKEGAEKYFNRFNYCAIDITKASTLLLPS